MGQKINPISLRLNYTNRHFDNCWYSNYFYKNLITKDLFIQSYLNNFLKQLKLPTGRYSLQHLQKKTQISGFFCFSKSTREWRSKIFGITKNKKSFRKSRFFFKLSSKFKRKFKKQTQPFQFYQSLNQLGVYKIQKKITSFQNFQLWSSFCHIQKKSFFDWGLFHYVKQTKYNVKKETLLKSFINGDAKLLGLQKQSNTVDSRENGAKKPKIDKNVVPFIPKNTSLNSKNSHLFLEQSSICNGLFLQNLLIYKMLKSHNFKKPSLENWFYKPSGNLFVVSKKPQFKTLDLKYAGYLESHLSRFFKQQIDFIPFKVKNDWQNANYLAEEIVYFLEKRLPFRRLKSKLVKQFSQIKNIRGVRITCSGRVGGKSKKAQRSKVECLKYGQTSLHVFSSPIDFAQKTAFTSFGSVGVKVWICYQ